MKVLLKVCGNEHDDNAPSSALVDFTPELIERLRTLCASVDGFAAGHKSLSSVKFRDHEPEWLGYIEEVGEVLDCQDHALCPAVLEPASDPDFRTEMDRLVILCDHGPKGSLLYWQAAQKYNDFRFETVGFYLQDIEALIAGQEDVAAVPA